MKVVSLDIIKLCKQNNRPQQKQSKWTFLNIAANVLLIFGLGFGSYYVFKTDGRITSTTIVNTEINNLENTMTLGDIFPDLKKVEDYYVADINLELSKMKLTPENKELFDGYVLRLEELNTVMCLQIN